MRVVCKQLGGGEENAKHALPQEAAKHLRNCAHHKTNCSAGIFLEKFAFYYVFLCVCRCGCSCWSRRLRLRRPGRCYSHCSHMQNQNGSAQKLTKAPTRPPVPCTTRTCKISTRLRMCPSKINVQQTSASVKEQIIRPISRPSSARYSCWAVRYCTKFLATSVVKM